MWNLFEYVGARALVLVDPTGRICQDTPTIPPPIKKPCFAECLAGSQLRYPFNVIACGLHCFSNNAKDDCGFWNCVEGMSAQFPDLPPEFVGKACAEACLAGQKFPPFRPRLPRPPQTPPPPPPEPPVEKHGNCEESCASLGMSKEACKTLCNLVREEGCDRLWDRCGRIRVSSQQVLCRSLYLSLCGGK